MNLLIKGGRVIDPTQKLDEVLDVLNLYDILGKKISELIASEKSSGKHSFVLNAGSFPSGVYTYVLNFNGRYESKKLMLIK